MGRLTIQELQEVNRRLMQATDAFAACRAFRRQDWLEALVGEVGEYANFSKKRGRGNISYHKFMQEAAKELADVQCYLVLLADCLGIDLESAVIAKFNEVSKRVGSPIRI